jgi:hypothetical protein
MRILIDECIDERFRNSLPGHDCQTARYAGLAGLKNGELLIAAETAKFNVFLTVDQGFEYQQNLTARKIAIIIFHAKSNRPERPVATRARLPRAHRIHSAWAHRHNRGLGTESLPQDANSMRTLPGLCSGEFISPSSPHLCSPSSVICPPEGIRRG